MDRRPKIKTCHTCSIPLPQKALRNRWTVLVRTERYFQSWPPLPILTLEHRRHDNWSLDITTWPEPKARALYIVTIQDNKTMKLILVYSSLYYIQYDSSNRCVSRRRLKVSRDGDCLAWSGSWFQQDGPAKANDRFPNFPSFRPFHTSE